MVLLYIRYIIGRCKIEKKYKILRTPYHLCHSRAGGNPSLCHCEERSDAAIPSFPLCHCELSKKVWQSHYSFISFIFFCHCEHLFGCAAISLFLYIFHLYLSFILNSHLATSILYFFLLFYYLFLSL